MPLPPEREYRKTLRDQHLKRVESLLHEAGLEKNKIDGPRDIVLGHLLSLSVTSHRAGVAGKPADSVDKMITGDTANNVLKKANIPEGKRDGIYAFFREVSSSHYDLGKSEQPKK